MAVPTTSPKALYVVVRVPVPVRVRIAAQSVVAHAFAKAPLGACGPAVRDRQPNRGNGHPALEGSLAEVCVDLRGSGRASDQQRLPRVLQDLVPRAGFGNTREIALRMTLVYLASNSFAEPDTRAAHAHARYRSSTASSLGIACSGRPAHAHSDVQRALAAA